MTPMHAACSERVLAIKVKQHSRLHLPCAAYYEVHLLQRQTKDVHGVIQDLQKDSAALQ